MCVRVCVFIRIGSLCFDFSVVQCSIRRSRARYISRKGKEKETILSSLQARFQVCVSKMYRKNLNKMPWKTSKS